MYVIEIGLNGTDWGHLAQDEDKWQSLKYTVR
jgi:hypothetical protein